MTDRHDVRARVRGDELFSLHHLARCAEAALDGVSAYERVDQRMLSQPFDRGHVAAHGVRKRDAREDRRAVDLDRAGAAMSLVARDLRPGEAELLAKHLRKPDADWRSDLVKP